MALIQEEDDHLAHLARQFRRLAERTGQARETAIGGSDFGPGVAHDPALNEQIDWFYRRWVQRVETAESFMLMGSDLLEGARLSYRAADEQVRRAADEPPARRVGADL